MFIYLYDFVARITDENKIDVRKPEDQIMRDADRYKSDGMLGGKQEPIIEVIDNRDSIIVMVEIHGFIGKEIKLNTDGSMFNINASSNGRWWASSIRLPSAIDPRSSEARYNNGVLEVVLKKGYYSHNGFVLIELV